MMDDPGSLANLRELAMPPEVAYWPPAPGCWIVVTALVLLLAMILLDRRARFLANAYRREAGAALNDIIRSDHAGSDTLLQISSVLKRIALAEHSRAMVASLTGSSWADFVTNDTREPGTEMLARLLVDPYGQDKRIGLANLRIIVGQAKDWVRRHGVAPRHR